MSSVRSELRSGETPSGGGLLKRVCVCTCLKFRLHVLLTRMSLIGWRDCLRSFSAPGRKLFQNSLIVRDIFLSVCGKRILLSVFIGSIKHFAILILPAVEPNFYSKNHLLLGKTFLRQNKKEEAKMWLDKAVNNNPCKTVDDEAVSSVTISFNK